MKSLLIVGLGSIGRRHARIFIEEGIEQIVGIDLRRDRVEQVRSELGIDALTTTFEQISRARRFDAVVVAVPGAYHTPIALAAASAGSHVFIEKPISNKLDDLDELARVIRERGLVGYTAYCYRFAPSSERMKEIIESGKLGRILSVRMNISTYLPDWHPWEDYRCFYAAKLEQGGGARLDESHGIDLLRWIFGEVATVYAVVRKISDLEIQADDLASMIVEFANGIIGEVHFDLYGRPPAIGAEVIGTAGKLVWDRISGKIALYDAAAKAWTEEDFGHDSFVTAYARQARHFIECVRTKSSVRTTVEDGTKTLAVLVAALQSSEQQCAIKVSV